MITKVFLRIVTKMSRGHEVKIASPNIGDNAGIQERSENKIALVRGILCYTPHY